VLLDLRSAKIIARTSEFLMEPEAYYEKFGLIPSGSRPGPW
jgi:predicted GH43/DUF377 family glycosyl hydrolase